jgi:hypothetical protein
MNGERLEPHFPMDTVQRFEKVREDAAYLQWMADLGDDLESINELTSKIKLTEVLGRPVHIYGGKLQTPALQDDNALNALIENDVASGTYLGLRWRKFSDNSVAPSQWQLCHVLANGGEEFEDFEGNEYTINRRTFVTAYDSHPQIATQADRHDFRKLHDDAFSLKLDQIAVDSEMNHNEKLRIYADMFGCISEDNEAPEKIDMMNHRLSYLNHLKVFNGMVCVTPYAYARTPEGKTSYLTNEPEMMVGTVFMVGFDKLARRLGDDILLSDESVLCLEIITEGGIVISAPYIPSKTALYERSVV